VALVFIGGVCGPRSTLAEPPAGSAEGLPDSTRASETGLAWSAAYASRYCFQGLDYSAGRPVVQPQLAASFRRLTFTIWGNGDPARGQLDELDLSLQGEWALDRLSGALGYTHLRYPHRDWQPTHEIFADLGVDAPLQPSLSIHWDVAAGGGRYWTLGLDHETPHGRAALALGARVFLHEHYYGMTGVPSLETHVGITVPWVGLSLQPSLSRFWTWENGDFRGDQAVGDGWVASLTCTSP
jgi:hypothetical protein